MGFGDELVEQECDFWGSLVLPGVFDIVRLVGVWFLATNLRSKNVVFWGSLVLPGVFGIVRLVGVWVLATNLRSKNLIFEAL